jgi:hypothetical protein
MDRGGVVSAEALRAIELRMMAAVARLGALRLMIVIRAGEGR